MRRAAAPFALVAVACLLLGSAPLGAVAQPATPPPTGIVGTGYLDPEYGWSVRWDASWTATPNETGVSLAWAGGAEGGGIGLVIQELSVAQVRADLGASGPIDAFACMGWATAPVPGSPVRQATDASGQPVGGGDASLAWAVFAFPGPDGVPYASYEECRALVPDVALLYLTATTPRAAFDALVPTIRAVVATLTVPAPR